MRTIPFIKYTAYGNNFIIVDEIVEPVFSETEKSDFSYQATNICFGIGSDNFLVIQPCRPEILLDINNTRRYWRKIPDSNRADFIFRMFEPDGEEAFCCGNGLMCVANYLYHQYGIDSARIMTEIPFATPNVITIGTKSDEAVNWASLGFPKRVPSEIVNPSAIKPYNEHIDYVEKIEINFRKHDLKPFANATLLSLSGYLVFTGEPHLVVFINDGFSLPELAQTIFSLNISNKAKAPNVTNRINFGSWLVNHIGSYINKHYPDLFPAGLNINFVRIHKESEEVEYRCFERGINRETMACGTGALASAYVVRSLGFLSKTQLNILPHKYGWYEPKARIKVEESESGWLLQGNPVKLLDGNFQRNANLNPYRKSNNTDILCQHLFKALEQQEFILYFQPQIKLPNSHIIGAEALLRWHSKTFGMVMPEKFLHFLENTNRIISIGEWILREACLQAKGWHENMFPGLGVAVNISRQQFVDKSLPNTVAKVLYETGLDPQYLELEITEELLVNDIAKATRRLHELKELGVRLAIDDFGAGFSSLSYLKEFPIDRLKIDRSFVKNITLDPRDKAATMAIVSLANSLNLNVTAEGVETKAQRVLLQNMGCNEMQGYLFSRPLPSRSYYRWLQGKDAVLLD